MTELTQAELDAMRVREGKADLAPWAAIFLDERVAKVPGWEVWVGTLGICAIEHGYEGGPEGIAEFIAHARTDQPRLRIALEAAYVRIAELEAKEGEEDAR